MADRATRGGGTAVSITVPTAAAQVNPNGGIDTGTGADWFGPGNPLKPMAPAAVSGRGWDIPVAYNLQQRPRAYKRVGFSTLRLMADSYDVLRLVIETRKDQMAALNWNIIAKDKAKAKDPDVIARIAKIEKFFSKPYPGLNWDRWIRMLLEDLFVIDAPCVYRRPTRGGQLFGLKPIDGALIKPVVDDWGDAPLPPYAAYQQILHGIVAVNYTSEQLLYRPRNMRTTSPYGLSPTEQVIAIVNIALRRENWQLSYFTEGNLPDSLIGVPSEWTPDQIRNFQDWFDARLSGNTATRRGATFVPGDVAKGVVNTKDTELFGKAEEWMARVVCFAFSIAPQGFVQMTNRATASTAKETAIQEGLEPTKKWITDLVQEVMVEDFNSPDLAFTWNEEVEIDPAVQNTITDIQVRSGRVTLNEARAINGQDPYDSTKYPEADMPLVLTATGFVPVGVQDQIDQKTAMQDAFPPPPPPTQVHIGPDGKPLPVPANDGGSQAAPQDGKPGAGGAGKPPKPAASGGGKATKKAASSESLPPAHCPIHKLTYSKAPEGVTLITIDRPAGRRAIKGIASTFAAALKDCGESVSAQVVKALRAQKVAKADDPEDHTAQNAGLVTAGGALASISDGHLDKIIADLDLSSLDVIYDSVDEDLFDLAVDSALKALAQVGVKTTDALVDQVNERAAAFAQARAAELVGKRVLADGSLIDNPNAKWAITDSTRDMVRQTIADGLKNNIGTSAIADALEESYAFSPERSEAIAHTEVANANEQSKLDGYRDAEALGVVLKKTWLTAEDDDVDEECEANADQGALGIDEDFQSGDDAPPAHVNCFPGHTLVSTANRITAASDRFYQGDVVLIRTASGQHLTATPNHPILTDAGWVGAGSLNVGSNVVRYLGRDGVSVGDLDTESVPTPIHEVAEAFGRSEGVIARPVPTSAPDFHGDGVEGEIAVVWSEGALSHGGKATDSEQGSEVALKGTLKGALGFGSKRHQDLGVGADGVTSGGGVGLGDLSGALLGVHVAPLESLRLRSSSDGDPSLNQAGTNGGAARSEVLGDGVLGHAAKVEARDLGGVDVQLGVGWDAPSSEFGVEDGRCDGGALLDRLQAQPGLVEFDRVVQIDRIGFSGHVYTLQTTGGWFLAEGIIAANCRCVLIAEVEDAASEDTSDDE